MRHIRSIALSSVLALGLVVPSAGAVGDTDEGWGAPLPVSRTGADVWVNGEYAGTTPLDHNDVTPLGRLAEVFRGLAQEIYDRFIEDIAPQVR